MATTGPLFLLFVFVRQGLLWLRQASDSLCSWGCLWPSDIFVSTFRFWSFRNFVVLGSNLEFHACWASPRPLLTNYILVLILCHCLKKTSGFCMNGTLKTWPSTSSNQTQFQSLLFAIVKNLSGFWMNGTLKTWAHHVGYLWALFTEHSSSFYVYLDAHMASFYFCLRNYLVFLDNFSLVLFVLQSSFLPTFSWKIFYWIRHQEWRYRM